MILFLDSRTVMYPKRAIQMKLEEGSGSLLFLSKFFLLDMCNSKCIQHKCIHM